MSLEGESEKIKVNGNPSKSIPGAGAGALRDFAPAGYEIAGILHQRFATSMRP
jgi:hypothetical protein